MRRGTIEAPRSESVGSAVRAVLRVAVRQPSQLAAARRKLRELLTSEGLPRSERESIVLAATEALSNALRACEGLGCEIEMTVSLVTNYVCVEVRDAGEGLRGVCVELIVAAPDSAERGRGLYIMRALMESLEIVPRPQGTLVRMIKRLEAEDERGGSAGPAA